MAKRDYFRNGTIEMMVLSRVFGEETPMGTEARRAFLLRRHIAMWDVLSACTISGAEDSSIRAAASVLETAARVYDCSER